MYMISQMSGVELRKEAHRLIRARGFYISRFIFLAWILMHIVLGLLGLIPLPRNLQDLMTSSGFLLIASAVIIPACIALFFFIFWYSKEKKNEVFWVKLWLAEYVELELAADIRKENAKGKWERYRKTNLEKRLNGEFSGDFSPGWYERFIFKKFFEKRRQEQKRFRENYYQANRTKFEKIIESCEKEKMAADEQVKHIRKERDIARSIIFHLEHNHPVFQWDTLHPNPYSEDPSFWAHLRKEDLNASDQAA